MSIIYHKYNLYKILYKQTKKIKFIHPLILKLNLIKNHFLIKILKIILLIKIKGLIIHFYLMQGNLMARLLVLTKQILKNLYSQLFYNKIKKDYWKVLPLKIKKNYII